MSDFQPDGQACQTVWGCVLIGGASRRMGRPKHLIVQNGCTWLEAAVATLKKRFDRVVISGKGEIPESLNAMTVVRDNPGLKGPLAGILSVMRWKPDVSWLVVGCDQPDIDEEAIDWLLSRRTDEVRALLPVLRSGAQVEPLLAYYDCRCKKYLEEIAGRKSFRIWEMKGRKGVFTPIPPEHLHRAWHNVNTPEQLK